VAAEFAFAAKTITEEPTHESRIFRERDHAIAYVAGREDLQFVAQPPGTSAVVRDGDNGRERVEPLTAAAIAPVNEPLQSGQHGRETCAAADGNQFQTALCSRYMQLSLALLNARATAN
jgi:hypothetical protein